VGGAWRGLKQQIVISHSSGGRKSKIKVSADLIPDEGSLLGLQMISFSWKLLMARKVFMVRTPPS
jgi:hypothetical protein